MKTLLPFFLIWNIITTFFVVIAAMRSSQLSHQEEQKRFIGQELSR